MTDVHPPLADDEFLELVRRKASRIRRRRRARVLGTLAVLIAVASLVGGTVMVADDGGRETRVVAEPGGPTTTYPPPEELTEPPVAKLRGEAGEVEGARGYFVWHQGVRGTPDPVTGGAPSPAPGIPTLVVRRGEELTVSHTVSAQPTELHVVLTLADPSQGRDLGVPLTNPVTFVADFPTGLQMLSVYSQWGGERFGAVLYEFMVDVRS